MKITFVGLSCFLLENDAGGRVLLDPYKDSPEYFLGLKFPLDLQADLFLVSHPDDDHSSLNAKMLRKYSDPNVIDLFPRINIQGTLVREFNGDINIAYSFTLDGLRFLHLADNAHVLTSDQLAEFGQIDVLFISPPKVNTSSVHVENIKLINPKVAILSHFIPVLPHITRPDIQVIKQALTDKFLQEWVTNPHDNQQTLELFTNMFDSILSLRNHFSTVEEVFDSTLNISKAKLNEDLKIVIFRQTLGE